MVSKMRIAIGVLLLFVFSLLLVIFGLSLSVSVFAEDKHSLLSAGPNTIEYATQVVKPILESVRPDDQLSLFLKLSDILRDPEKGIGVNRIDPDDFFIYDMLKKFKLGFLYAWKFSPAKKQILRRWRAEFMQKDPADVLFAPSADEIIRTKAAFGCTHYARAFIAVVKSLGLVKKPRDLRYVISCKADDYNHAMEKKDYHRTINGHQFVIIRIDSKWVAINTSKGESLTMPEGFSPDALRPPGNIPIEFKSYPGVVFLIRKIGRDFNDDCRDDSLSSLMNISRSGESQNMEFLWKKFVIAEGQSANNRSKPGGWALGLMTPPSGLEIITVGNKPGPYTAPNGTQATPGYSSVYKSPGGYAAVVEAYKRVLKVWPVPYETRLVPTRFGQTHVICCGAKDAPPLVLLHGGGNCALMWIYCVAGLSRHFRIYAPDTMGDVGLSVPSRPLTRASDYAEWFADTLDGLKLKRTNVAGISWGGGTALSAALLAPDRVDRVVAMCPAWGLAKPRLLTFLFHVLPPALFPSQNRVRKLFQWLSAKEGAFSTPLDEPFIDYLVVALKHYKIRRGNLWVFSDNELRMIKAPTLLLIGDHEVLYDPKTVAKRAGQLLPNVKIEIIPKAGHALFYDQPDIVNKQIVEFLRHRRSESFLNPIHK